MQRLAWALGAFALAACGPAGIGSQSESNESSSTTGTSTTSMTTSESEEGTDSDPSTETSTMDPPGTLTFVPDTDLNTAEDCDIFEQDCPAGEKCVPYGSTGSNWDAHKCVLVTGDQGIGDPCTYGGVVEATDDCDEDTHCWDVVVVDDEPVGTCTPFCTGTLDNASCPPGYLCSHYSVLVICTEMCDPLVQDCGEGLGCFWVTDGFTCVFTTQDTPLGEPCGFINDCAAGLICANADTVPNCQESSCCTAFCDLELGDEPCVELPGTACLPLFEEGEALVGFEHVGVCISPP